MLCNDETTLTAQQAADAQTALRRALGLAPEHFPVEAFVGMVSDEIEQLRAQGKTDDQIAGVIADAIGVQLPVGDIARFYASPEERCHHGHGNPRLNPTHNGAIPFIGPGHKGTFWEHGA